MAIYLIDYENVNMDGLNGIQDLSEADQVYIFYSDNANKLTFGLHQQIVESPAWIRYVNAETGAKNALDFQLATYLGYLVSQSSAERFCLVSKDSGFQAVVKFWQKKKVDIQLASDLTGTDSAEEKEKLLVGIRAVLSDKEEAPAVLEFIRKYKTKQGINNALVKKYGSKGGGEIYKSIKPLLAAKK